jgi:hypothetical protein
LDEGRFDSTSGSLGSSVADTLIEKGALDADVEPALVIDTWKEQESQGDLAKASITHPVLFSKPPQSTNPVFWPDPNTIAIEGSDWRLLTMDKLHQLPNCIPFQQSAERSSQGGQDQAPARACPPKYLEAYPTELSKRGVYILAGVSGVCPGVLAGNISFLSLRGEGSRIVWSVKLDAGFGKRSNSFSRTT